LGKIFAAPWKLLLISQASVPMPQASGVKAFVEFISAAFAIICTIEFRAARIRFSHCGTAAVEKSLICEGL
jgi:hypothetical protein